MPDRLGARLAALTLAAWCALLLLLLLSPPPQRPRSAMALEGRSQLEALTGGSVEEAAAGEERAEVERPLRLDRRTAAALAMSAVVSALANSAGVGGGAFFVPLFK